MKPKSALRSFLLLAGSAFLAAPLAHALTLTWDATAGGAINDGAGAWLGAGQWNDTGTPSITWTSGDDAIFGVGGTGGAVTLASPTTVNSLTLNTYITTGYTLGTAGQTITLNNGITKNAGGVAASIISPILLAGPQTWTNNSSANLNATGGVDNGGNTLTIDGTGRTDFSGSLASVFITGSGGLTKNGTGYLALSGAGTPPTHNYSGKTTLNGGTVLIQNGNNSTGTGNLEITNGTLEYYFGGSWTRAQGTGAGQVQITGGTSGFSGQGATSTTFNIGATAQWGSATFNPTVFLLGASTANTNGKGTFSTAIDLNGLNRTITSTQNTDGAASSGMTISGVISNSTGTAGFEKTGVGNLILNATNTFNGALTITGGWITAGASDRLGNGSATNTLIFNGGILRATGAITSPATRGVTLTSTGTIDNNGQAITIAGDIAGAGGLTKNGAGTLTLSGTNSYGGVTAVNVGTLAIAKEASLYNASPASWTAANINVKSGAALAVNVDSAGTAGFTSANLTTLLGNISVANTASQGLQGGAILGIDTSTATGGTFTLGSAITNSTGAFGGVINLTKIGAGTLVLDQANTYTGNTTINGGTIQYSDGVAIPTSPIVNNAAFTSAATGSLTQGTNFGLISGTGTVTQSGSGTLTLNLANTYTGTTTAAAGTIVLSNALAIQNSALNTTGAGFVTLSGVTSPTFGGLSNSGTTRDLATVISTGYTGVTNLTLNPQSGSVTYDGVIGDGAAGMSLTKTGAGTQVLTGINTYTGATNLNVGTLTLSGTGSILPSAITLNGGGLTLTNTAAETGSGRVNDTTVITSNGGTLTYTNTSGANDYAETIGTLDLVKGQANLVLSTDQVGAGSQTLTLAGLTRTGAANASAITFSAAGAGLNATKNRILVTGATPLPTPAGGIIAPWATIGTAANVQTAFAAYDASGYVVAATPTGAPSETDLSSASGNYDINTGSLYTLSATRTVNAVQFRGALSTLDLSTFKLETNGFFFSGGAGNAKTITAGVGGALTTPTGGGNLYITCGQVMTAGNEHKINAPITDNSGNANLVKSGAGILILNGLNTYTGDTIINAGTLRIGTNATANGANLNGGSYAGNIFIGAGATFDVQTNAAQTLSGVISGDGSLVKRYTGTLTLSGANTYTGKTFLTPLTTAGAGVVSVSSFNSVNGGTPLLESSSLGAPTTVANGTIEFGAGNVQSTDTIRYTGTGETTDRVLNFNFNGTGTRILEAATSGLLKFTSTFTSNGTTTSHVTLQGASNGEIVGGLPFTFTNFTKSGAGTWTLGGPLRNTGTSTINGGTLILNGQVSTTGLTTVTGASTILTLSGNNSMPGGVTVTSSRLNIGNANALGTGTLSIGGTGPSIDNTSGSALTIATNNAQTWNGDFTFAGTNSLNLGTGAVALGGNRNITVTANTLTVGGIISGVARGIQKSGAGTLVLTGANTYGGATTVSGGTLAMGANDVLPDTSNVTIANGTLNAATFDDTAGTLAVTNAASTINLGSGANLVFADSSAVAWTGGTLNITGTFVSGSSLKFGSSNAALTPAQLLAISASGFSNFGLDANGFLTADSGGGAPEIAVEQPAATDIANGGSQGFGTVTLGSNTSLVFTIRNTGTANLNLTGSPLVAVSGTNAADFTVTALPSTPVTSGGGTTTFTVQFAPGGAGARSAVLTIANNDSDEGTFTINVSGTGQTQYDAWSGGAAFGADANGDGVDNGLAFLLGAAGPNVNALGLLPVVTHSGGNLVLTFSMLNSANRGSASLNVEHSSNLGISDPWTAVLVPNTSGGPTSGVTFTVTPGSPTNGVVATISSTEALSGKLFGRLKAQP